MPQRDPTLPPEAAASGAPRGESRAGARYHCNWCGYVYDPDQGETARNTPAGTPFRDLPEDWCCPDCRAPLADFTALGAPSG